MISCTAEISDSLKAENERTGRIEVFRGLWRIIIEILDYKSQVRKI